MIDIKAVERVVIKRMNRGAKAENITDWLNGLKDRAWKKHPEMIDEVILQVKTCRLSTP